MNKQHVMLITGCPTGLGASLAVQAAQQGWTVVATMRDLRKRAALDAAANDAKAALHLLALDVQRSDSVNAAVAEVVGRHGRIDVLVNNAGMGFARATEQASEADIAKASADPDGRTLQRRVVQMFLGD